MPTVGLARLAPLPGGERRLREALRDRGTHAIGWKLPLAGACASLCVLALAYALQPDPLDAEVRRAVNEAAAPIQGVRVAGAHKSEEHTSELQSLMSISYAVFCLKKK